MPFTTLGSADGSYRCQEATCRGHLSPQRFTVELIVDVETQQPERGGPITVFHSERRPYELPKTCPECGGPVEITEPPVTSDVNGRHLTLRWPEPRVPIGHTQVNRVIPAPPAERTLEQRVEELERERVA